jgi:hypothetical protein
MSIDPVPFGLNVDDVIVLNGKDSVPFLDDGTIKTNLIVPEGL